MTSETVLDRNTRAFREFIQQMGWAIVAESEILSGHQFRVTDGRDKIPVSLYTTGKILIQGKAGGLQAEIQNWWQGLNTSTSSAQVRSPTAVSASLPPPPATIGRTARFYVAQGHIEQIKGNYSAGSRLS